MTSLLALVLASAAGLTIEARAEDLRDVEQARYAFSVDARERFDDAYPPAVFREKARRQEERERELRVRLRVWVTPADLSAEYDRIERDTRAPDQWRAMKAALGNDRRRIEEVICRPLVVERLLRTATPRRR